MSVLTFGQELFKTARAASPDWFLNTPSGVHKRSSRQEAYQKACACDPRMRMLFDMEPKFQTSLTK